LSGTYYFVTVIRFTSLGGYLSTKLIGRMDAFLEILFKCGVASTVLTVSELMDIASYKLFFQNADDGTFSPQS
jgi:hypothetical protein